jgi:hypothetical protein
VPNTSLVHKFSDSTGLKSSCDKHCYVRGRHACPVHVLTGVRVSKGVPSEAVREKLANPSKSPLIKAWKYCSKASHSLAIDWQQPLLPA